MRDRPATKAPKRPIQDSSADLSGDRRVLRTKQALQRALIELIVEQGYEATNVSQVADRANVGRSTFYAHYADKDDLLQGSAEGLKGWLEDEVQRRVADGSHDGHPALAFCLPMLEHASEARDIFAAMVGRHGGYLFQELVHDIWADLVRASWPEGKELEVQALVGAFASTLLWWLTKSPDTSAKVVEQHFVSFVASALPRR